MLLASPSHGLVRPRPTRTSKVTALRDVFCADLASTASYPSEHSAVIGGVNHRHSAKDWMYNVRSLPQSSVLRDIRNPVVTIAAWSAFVSVIHKVLATSSTAALRKIAENMCIGSTPHNFLVSSLGLLLVFRTNSAYQRFTEGRKIWADILNIARNLSRMINLYENEVGGSRAKRIINLIAAFPYLLRHHIRPGCLCGDDSIQYDAENRLLLRDPLIEMIETRHEGDKTSGGSTLPLVDGSYKRSKRQCWVDKRNLPWSLLEKTSLQKVAIAQNRPLWVCDRISRQIMSIPYGPNFTSRERLSLLGQVDKLNDSIGQCERIHQTAVPLNYARHSLRSLALWLITLPFALVKDLGLLTAPCMAIMAWVLFGVYQIGYSIEDPFQGTLRLSVLSDAIRRDVLGDSTERQSAFSLEWDEGHTEVHDDLIPQPDLVFPLMTPKLIQENGSWNIVGVVKA